MKHSGLNFPNYPTCLQQRASVLESPIVYTMASVSSHLGNGDCTTDSRNKHAKLQQRAAESWNSERLRNSIDEGAVIVTVQVLEMMGSCREIEA